MMDIVIFGVVNTPGTKLSAMNKKMLVSIGAAKADDNKTRDDKRNSGKV
jgi:hypothetical protein